MITLRRLGATARAVLLSRVTTRPRACETHAGERRIRDANR